MNRVDAVDRCKWRKMIKVVRWSGWVCVGECFFWYRPTRVVPDQRPLNGCVCVCCRFFVPSSIHPSIGLMSSYFDGLLFHVADVYRTCTRVRCSSAAVFSKRNYAPKSLPQSRLACNVLIPIFLLALLLCFLYVLLFYYFYFFIAFCQTNYLNIYHTDLHDICRIYRTLAVD